MTPEGKVKEEIKRVLHTLGIMPASRAGAMTALHRGWYYMPVSNGMGTHGIPDFIGHCDGRFFAIEAKTETGKLSAFQAVQVDALRRTGAAIFVAYGSGDLQKFVDWANNKVDR